MGLSALCRSNSPELLVATFSVSVKMVGKLGFRGPGLALDCPGELVHWHRRPAQRR